MCSVTSICHSYLTQIMAFYRAFHVTKHSIQHSPSLSLCQAFLSAAVPYNASQLLPQTPKNSGNLPVTALYLAFCLTFSLGLGPRELASSPYQNIPLCACVPGGALLKSRDAHVAAREKTGKEGKRKKRTQEEAASEPVIRKRKGKRQGSLRYRMAQVGFARGISNFAPCMYATLCKTTFRCGHYAQLLHKHGYRIAICITFWGAAQFLVHFPDTK